jgi:hypothetical protein
MSSQVNKVLTKHLSAVAGGISAGLLEIRRLQRSSDLLVRRLPPAPHFARGPGSVDCLLDSGATFDC